MVSPTLPKDCVTAADDAPATLPHQAASNTPDAQPRGPVSDKSPDTPIPQASAATLGPPDLSAQIPRDRRPIGKRGALARVAIVVCLGASAIGGWRLYGGVAREMIATGAAPYGRISAQVSADPRAAPHRPDPAPEQAAAPPEVKTAAPPPAQGASQTASIARPGATAAQGTAAASANRQQLETMARDLALLRQTVEQLAAGQEQLTGEIAKLQDEKARGDKPPAPKPSKRMQDRLSAPGHVSDAFDPAQNPNAPGVPRTLGSIVLRRASPRRRARPRRPRRKPLLGSRR
jgi:hypothetical protein